MPGDRRDHLFQRHGLVGTAQAVPSSLIPPQSAYPYRRADWAAMNASANAARAIADHPGRAQLTALTAFTVGEHTVQVEPGPRALLALGLVFDGDRASAPGGVRPSIIAPRRRSIPLRQSAFRPSV